MPEEESRFDAVLEQNRHGVFISHITEEKPVALVLQKYLKLSFGGNFRVFVSSDAKSIGGGKNWYNHVIDNLRVSKVVLVLISQESGRREWINFEAGFGEGMGGLVIPVAIRNFPLVRMSFPMAGIQGRNVDDIGTILEDVANHIGFAPAEVDANAYLAEIREAESKLIYKSIRLEPVIGSNVLSFEMENIGNIDVELLMLETSVPRRLILRDHLFSQQMMDVGTSTRGNVPCQWFGCYSNRGVYGRMIPVLRPVLTPSMGKVRPDFQIPIKFGLIEEEKELSIYFQIHALGYSTEEQQRKVSDLGWS